ncbi:MAG: zinc-ribbon domain-containing protein [Candidatus Methanomethylicia archaeon]|nr:zinc-ribbon domain-containing protein [Candidatus Methanomethylicia archaeon]
MSEAKFCSRCGAPQVEGASFCSRCGAPVRHIEAGVQPPPGFAPPMEREPMRAWEDRTGPFVGGGILIWLGITFYLATIEYLSWAIWWAYFICGIGLILVFQGIVHFIQGAYREKITGPIIGGSILFLVGAFFISAFSFGIGNWWPFLFMFIGIIIILTAVLVKRH